MSACFVAEPPQLGQCTMSTSSSLRTPRLAWRTYLGGYVNTKNGGFTLIEALVVMGILTMLGGLGLFMNLDTYHGFMFRSERDTMNSALSHARSQSMNNMCLGAACTDGKAHGVYITKGKYVIFQGQSYATRDLGVDEVIYAQNDTVQFASSSYEVVFAQLSGSVASPVDIAFTDGMIHYSTTSVNAEGRISWTN